MERGESCKPKSKAVRVDGRIVHHKLHPCGGVESRWWQSARSKMKLMLNLLDKAYIPSLLSKRNQERSNMTNVGNTLAFTPAATEYF